MTFWIARAGVWLALQTAGLQDTIVTKTVSVEPTLFERVTGIASGLVSLTLLVLTVALVPAAWNFRKSYKRWNKLLDRVYGDINPIMRHASSIADNVDYITTSVRADVQQLNQALAAARQRLDRAVAQTERRLHEFNALLAVAQEEAEGAFVATASTVRGMRAGAEAFRTGDEELDYGEADAALADDLDEEEAIDGDDSAHPPTGHRPGPRIRPRRGV